MSRNMNRTLTSGVGLTLAMIGILSCSGDKITGTSSPTSDDLSADASLIASVTVSLRSSSIAVGDTTTATSTLRDWRGRILQNRVVTWSSSNSSVATISTDGLITGKAAGTAVITAARAGKSGSATITVIAAAGTPAAPSTGSAPSQVQNLAASAIDSTSVSLSFTQADDGTGQPAKYDVRFAVAPISWGSATSVATGSCATPLAGTAVGSQITCQVSGLRPSTSYNFQVVAFRGTMNQDAVYGALSNVAAATTTASNAPPPPPPPPPAAVASISVSPSTATLNAGATSQLTATTRDASNNVLTGRTITWVSANTAVATVSATGLVTAKAAGTAQVTATSEGKSASASITVNAVAPPPPPPPTGSGNEPSGMTTITDEPFSVLPSSNCRGYYTYSLPVDATAPYSPGNVFKVNYPAGYNGGDSPGLTECPIASYHQVYMSMYLKFSSNWQGHLTHVNKIIHFWIGGSNKLFLLGDASGSQPLLTSIGIQGVASSPYGTSAQVQPNLVSNAQFVRGRWHHLEMLAVGNNNGASDGTVDLWLDGVKVARLTGIQWSSGTPSFSTAKLDPTWGGLGDTVSSDMSLEVDHLYMSGKN